MAAMFTMMNNARLGVGVQALGAGRSGLSARAGLCAGSQAGRDAGGQDGTGTILDHADVRRMLTGMKADIFASRALSLDLRGVDRHGHRDRRCRAGPRAPRS
jgi:acyl-CoA dehydrogenase